MRIKKGILLSLFMVLPAVLFAQDKPPARIQVEGGLFQIHTPELGGAGTFRYIRPLDAQGFNYEIKITFGASEGGGWLGGDIGVRYIFKIRSISPFIGAGLGVGTCGDWTGISFHGTFGFELDFGNGNYLPVSIQFGIHGGETGPTMYAVGIGWRLGTKR